MRGYITEQIQEKSKKFLGRQLSQKELRLYPYIDYCIKNACQGWDYEKINSDELDILDQLYKENHIIYSSEKIIVSRDFYNFIQDVLADSYVIEFI